MEDNIIPPKSEFGNWFER